MLGMLVVGIAVSAAEPPDFVFRDAGNEAGLFPAVEKIAGHGAIWGDIDGDGWADLYVGTFGGAPYDSKSNQLFRNVKGKFTRENQPAVEFLGRANGGVLADFDNDGDLDLFATNHTISSKKPETQHFSTPCKLFRNDGQGKFTDLSDASGACPAGMACRSASAVDYNGDGKLDLLVGECFFQGGKSRTRLYRNEGELKFTDVTNAAGLPAELTGFGVAAGDLSGDGWPDLLVVGRHHGDRIFINNGKGVFQELPAENAHLGWENFDSGDDTSCGACIADVNRDGLPDVLLGSHFGRPWFGEGIPVRLYLNEGITKGLPKFKEVTEQAGLVPLPLKSPHVEVQDFDNDGWPDIYTTIVKFAADGAPHPTVFKHLGVKNGLPQFRCRALEVNDFPTAEDKAIGGSGKFFEKMIVDKKIVYSAPGPVADYDRDGKLDMFLPNWWPELRSLLLHNDTPAGNWLQLAVKGKEKVNRQGIGAVIRIYPAGKLGDAKALWGAREIAVGFGYASGQEAIAHFGLADLTECDLEIFYPHGLGRSEHKGVKANQRLTLEAP